MGTSSESSPLAHIVYFTLKDKSEAAQAKLAEGCQRHLSGHPGTLFFGVGTVSELSREVNVRDYEVGLHVVFENKAAHDAYQAAPRHLTFIEENKENWERVRVFDTYLAG